MRADGAATSHADLLALVLSVAQQHFGTAKAFALMLAKDQAGEQLRECEILAAELAGILPHGSFGHLVGEEHHLPWRFAG
jgi:hypothetical protein